MTELMILTISILIVGLLIYFAVDNCKIELKYRNTLLEKQNEILEKTKNSQK
ncbi:hypothetical protein GCM10022389_15960 [Flavobacterium cheonanense]|uniref:Phage protein n=1 Tax=Flavobacterium cheonanense TaxID=706183 RepID=A0ABP7VRN1_9FLAO